MPFPSDHITVEIDEVRKLARAYMNDIPISAKNRKTSNLQQSPTVASKHDMFTNGFIISYIS